MSTSKKEEARLRDAASDDDGQTGGGKERSCSQQCHADCRPFVDMGATAAGRCCPAELALAGRVGWARAGRRLVRPIVEV